MLKLYYWTLTECVEFKVTGYPLNNFVGAKINDLKSSLDRFMC